MKSKALFIIWLCVAMVCASFIIAFSNPDVRLWAALVSLVDAFIFVFFGMNEGSYEDHKDLCIQTNKGVAGGGFICVFFACLFLAVSNWFDSDGSGTIYVVVMAAFLVVFMVCSIAISIGIREDEQPPSTEGGGN